jgi:pyroglutamyl-peptidase
MENVVVTGFGLFRDHTSNPSWDAIKDGRLEIDRPNVNVITQLVRVSYREVDRLVGQLWDTYKPILMVHIGLAAFEDSIRIEQVARHGPYLHNDVDQYAPHDELRRFYEQQTNSDTPAAGGDPPNPSKFDCSKTCFNVERVCDRLNKLHKEGKIPIGFKCSQDAGLYVCEYIYQTSLRRCDRAVFIHVPDTGKFSLEDIRLALKFTIELLLDELNEVQ